MEIRVVKEKDYNNGTLGYGGDLWIALIIIEFLIIVAWLKLRKRIQISTSVEDDNRMGNDVRNDVRNDERNDERNDLNQENQEVVKDDSINYCKETDDEENKNEENKDES
ncbi:hypothetical protein SteCoe_6358 [Stentor coeruleus]|uniref:Uncharacterized protein n=1 Tax=Stentor coeruleus TaxID=5963 RepID=A0A1R2CQA0_9CILI|nr:hypothetical protein SteCoe_6358 [Stentor coeruleus]